MAPAGSFDPLRLKVTVPGTPFTVPVKVSMSWNLALHGRNCTPGPPEWRIKVPCTVDVPVNVPV